MFGINWTMPSVVGPQWIIDGQKATPSEISWFGKQEWSRFSNPQSQGSQHLKTSLDLVT